MGNSTEYFADVNQFINSISNMIQSNSNSEIFISGEFDNMVYREILNKIRNCTNLKACKIIIPYIPRHGVISRPNLNKICQAGCQVRINSRFNKNVILIGENAAVISLGHKYTKENGIKNYFSCSMVTNDSNAVEKIKKTFMNAWHGSMPLVNE